jgi:hypothetical protein
MANLNKIEDELDNVENLLQAAFLASSGLGDDMNAMASLIVITGTTDMRASSDWIALSMSSCYGFGKLVAASPVSGGPLSTVHHISAA